MGLIYIATCKTDALKPRVSFQSTHCVVANVSPPSFILRVTAFPSSLLLSLSLSFSRDLLLSLFFSFLRGSSSPSGP